MKDNLIKIKAQLLGIWQELGLSQRITVAATGAITLLAIGALAVWSGKPHYSLLYGNLPPEEANKVVSFLDEKGITYELGANGTSISIPNKDVHRVRIELAGKGIPDTQNKVGLEIFDKPVFGLSNMQQRINHTRAIQGELSNTISMMNSIESAEVMVVMPENRLIGESITESSASVFVKTTGGIALPQNQVRAIQFLVGNSVEGLTPDKVAVTNAEGQLLSAEEGDASVTVLANQRLESQRQIEAYFSEKAEYMLNRVLGPDQAVVQVFADINFDTKKSTEVAYMGEAIELKMSETSDKVTTNAEENQPVVGVAGNTLNNTNSVASAAPASTLSEKTVVENNFLVPSLTNDVVRLAGGINRLSAAVFINHKKDGTNTVERSGAEIQSITKIVASALGITNIVDNLTVEQFAFPPKVENDILDQLKVVNRNRTYLEIGKQIAYFAIGLTVLGMFRRSLKKTETSDIPIGINLEEYAKTIPGGGTLNGSGANAGSNGAEANPLAGLRGASMMDTNDSPESAVTVEILNRLIRENPANMSHAIKEWLNEDDAQG